jgi:hypothetical protein
VVNRNLSGSSDSPFLELLWLLNDEIEASSQESGNLIEIPDSFRFTFPVFAKLLDSNVDLL